MESSYLYIEIKSFSLVHSQQIGDFLVNINPQHVYDYFKGAQSRYFELFCQPTKLPVN